MGQARDEAGNIWETDAQGNPVRLLQPAAPTGGQVLTLPENPRDAAKDARAEAAADRAASAAQQKAEIDAVRADIERERLRILRDKTASPNGRAPDAKALARIANLDALVQQINRVEELYQAGPGATSGISGLSDYLPTPSNRQFDTAAAGLAEQGLAAFRVPGVGAQSDTELRQFVAANKPSASDFDTSIEEKLRQLRARVDANRQSLGLEPADWNGQRAEPEVDPVTGATRADANTPSDPGDLPPANMPGGNEPTPPPFTPTDPNARGVASGETRTINHPEVASLVTSLMQAGAGLATINAALKERNASPISFSDYANAKKWMEQNPGKAYPVRATEQVPMTLLQRLSGSPTGAFLANVGNTGGMGIPEYLAGDVGKGALEAMRIAHPDSSGIGSITGGVTGAGLMELGLAARAPAALARFAPRAADTIFGGVSGFTGAEEGNRAAGAALGAGAGLAGGYLGEKAVGLTGSALRGITDPSAQFLRQQDIPLTVGQAVGNSGTIGAGVKKVEDSLTSMPFVGNMVDARRMEGLDAFNRAAFQTAAPPGAEITATGGPGMAQLKQAVGEAYDNALDPVQIRADDPDFINDLAGAIQSAQAIPNVNSAQDAAMSGLESRITGAIDPATDMMSGRGFQEAYRGLARTGRERANSDYGHEVGQVMRQGQDALGGVLERQNPGAFDAFLEANAANRRANVLAQALGPAANQTDELITPAQLNRADVQSTSRLEGKINSAAGNRPFYDLATAGQAVLPSKLPDSGTWTRAATGLALTGAAGGAGYGLGGGEGAATGTGAGLGATLALMAGGSRPAQRLLVKALMDRPDFARLIGEEVQRNARIGGWTGAGVLAPLVAGQ